MNWRSADSERPQGSVEPPVPESADTPAAEFVNAIALDYGDFYRRELPVMTALAAAVSGRSQVAEDIAQDALIKAYRRWDQVGRYDNPGAWVRRVTINQALSVRKRAGRELRARLRTAALLDRSSTASSGALTPTSPEFDHIWAAVAQLPGNQRAAVALHYLEDLPVNDIAEVLGCSPATARVHLHRGRTTLASRLEATS